MTAEPDCDQRHRSYAALHAAHAGERESAIEGGIVVTSGKLGKLERERGETEQKITITKRALAELEEPSE